MASELIKCASQLHRSSKPVVSYINRDGTPAEIPAVSNDHVLAIVAVEVMVVVAVMDVG